MPVVLKGMYVDVVIGEMYPAELEMLEGKILNVRRVHAAPDRYLLPGFIDSHIHLESSLLVPSRFAQVAVAHGTTATVSDPHEIANVLGMEGIEFMMRETAAIPMRVFFTAPSCVPATPWESSGATLGSKEIGDLLSRKEFVALGEMMDVSGVLSEEREVCAKLEAAHREGKPVDGHAPRLSGERLARYIMAGISTDHECTAWQEALEKHQHGMRIQVREGTSSKNMKDLMPFAKEHECYLVSDDLHAADLMQGHMDILLRKAVSAGMGPMHAIRAATLWPARHYGLPGGALDEGSVADVAVVKDLKDFQVLQTFIGGVKVAENGRSIFPVSPLNAPTAIRRLHYGPKDFEMLSHGPTAKVRLIEVQPDQDISKSGSAELEVIGNIIQPDIEEDVLRMTVVNRYREAKPALTFVHGFGLKRGAIASSVAHDSHNIIAVGVESESLAMAVEEVSGQGGFLAVDGGRSMSLPLPVAGLMSREPCEKIAAAESDLLSFVRGLGGTLPAPFMTLSFQSLLVEPELKLGDRGLFDSKDMVFVDPIIIS